MFMMVGCVQEELDALKHGLNDVIPNDLLAGLTAEVCNGYKICCCCCQMWCSLHAVVVQVI